MSGYGRYSVAKKTNAKNKWKGSQGKVVRYKTTTVNGVKKSRPEKEGSKCFNIRGKTVCKAGKWGGSAGQRDIYHSKANQDRRERNKIIEKNLEAERKAKREKKRAEEKAKEKERKKKEREAKKKAKELAKKKEKARKKKEREAKKKKKK